MRSATAASVVLCFHNLPPLLPIAGRTLCLIQNRNVIDPSGYSGMTIRVRLRTWLEYLVARWLGGSIDRYFVQTPTMARVVALLRKDSAVNVVVAPFAEALDPRPSAPLSGAPRWDFIYVADGQAHKNHRRLIQAWQSLAKSGLRPSLALTLGPRDDGLAAELLRNAAGLEVANLGELSRADVLALYRDAGALVFPSTVESFGLPLVEASAMGLPILAAELDFVRDVCVPVESFDPLSAISIARAVRRFLGEPESPVAVEEPGVFAKRILAERVGE
jgi:glycosyltransferase involved in cell wall biosynthesis